jgi:hypothetical protein
MELDDLNWQAVNHTLLVLGDIKHRKRDTADVVNGTHQVAPPSVKSAPFGQNRKEMGVITPFAEQVCFLIPFATFTNNGHGNQFSVGAFRGRATSLVQGTNLLPDVINQHVHPGHKVVEFGYHQLTSCMGDCSPSKFSHTIPEVERQLFN